MHNQSHACSHLGNKALFQFNIIISFLSQISHFFCSSLISAFCSYRTTDTVKKKDKTNLNKNNQQ